MTGAALAAAFANSAAAQDAAAAVGMDLDAAGGDDGAGGIDAAAAAAAAAAAPIAPVAPAAGRGRGGGGRGGGPGRGRGGGGRGGRQAPQHQRRTVEEVLAELHAQVRCEELGGGDCDRGQELVWWLNFAVTCCCCEGRCLSYVALLLLCKQHTPSLIAAHTLPKHTYHPSSPPTQVEYCEEAYAPTRENLVKLLAAVDKRDKFRIFVRPVTEEQVRVCLGGCFVCRT